MHVGIAGVLLERDDLAAPASTWPSAIASGLQRAAAEPVPVARRHGPAAEAEGDLDAALELLDEADRVYVGDYLPNVRPVPAVRARLRLRRGELDEAEAWARERQLSPDDELSYLREYEHVTLARLLLARHRRIGTAARSRTRSACSIGCSRPRRTAGEAGAFSRS
jgi:LuxR family maltose regulon positive regulatory protein